MNLDKILRKLYIERVKLDEIIASLEQLRRSAAVAGKPIKNKAKKTGLKTKKAARKKKTAK